VFFLPNSEPSRPITLNGVAMAVDEVRCAHPAGNCAAAADRTSGYRSPFPAVLEEAVSRPHSCPGAAATLIRAPHGASRQLVRAARMRSTPFKGRSRQTTHASSARCWQIAGRNHAMSVLRFPVMPEQQQSRSGHS
jgi:hypothetical protein